MLSIGSAELVIILGIILFVVGPKRLPEVARMLGKAMRKFKKAMGEFTAAIESEPPESLKKDLTAHFNKKELPLKANPKEEQ